MRNAGALVVCLLLTACGGMPSPETTTQTTIADLDDSPVVSDATLTGDARDKAIVAYLDYLERYPASPEGKRIKRRVADLLLERAADARARVPASPPRTAAAQQDYTAAIELYRQLLDDSPGQREAAQLRYQLARAYEESGQARQANAELQRLLRGDRVGEDSRLYADAQFRHGERMFSEGDMAQAEQAYRAVLRLGESVPVYRQAGYKLGWTLYKRGRYQQALAQFFALIDSSLPPDTEPDTLLAGLSRADQEQLNDVFRGVSLCFSHLRGADSVDAYFKRVGDRPYRERVYRDLAALYVDKEFFSDAAKTYLALARRDPLTPASADLYVQVIALYRRAGLTPQVRQVEAALVRDFGLDPAFRTRHPLSTLPRLRRELESALVNLARHHHAAALQNADTDAYRAAEQWYRTYLQLFPDSERAPDMSLGLAGLHYDQGRYDAAASEYEHAAYGYGRHPAAADAGRSALDAHARKLAAAEEQESDSAKSDATASALRFVDTFPDDADAPAIFAGAGVALLEAGRPQQAIQQSERMLERVAPASPLRPIAWSLKAQAAYQLEDYQTAEQSYRRALALTAAGDPQRPALRKGLAASLYKQAEQKRENGELQASAALFQRAAEVGTDPALAGQASYDAAADLLALEHWPQAILLLENFDTAYPRHPLRRQALLKLAFAYERSGRPQAAAEQYLQLASNQDSDQELRREALLRAAALYQQSGSNGSAIRVLARYVADFPQPPQPLVQICQRLAELHLAQGNRNQHRRWLLRVLSSYDAAGQSADADDRRTAARASLALAEQQAASFQRIALVEPLQETLPAKLQALQSAIAGFEQAKSYREPSVGSAADYQIADMYDALGQALLASERPRGLNAREIEQYEQLLTEQAEPFRGKAIEIHEINLRRTAAGHYDVWIEKSLRRLAQLQPLRYAKEERSEPLVESLR